MNTDQLLTAMRDVIQQDVGNRGLARDPHDNLLTACPGDFAAACRGIAETPNPAVCVVTGFFIPHGQPPACETDGPLGALFIAAALSRLRIPVLVVADASMERALEAGFDAAGLHAESSEVATAFIDRAANDLQWVETIVFPRKHPWTHLIALERVGPSHTTGEFTHITHADVDAERDVIFKDLEQNGELAEVIVVQGFQKVLEGRNGQNLYEGVIAAKAQ